MAHRLSTIQKADRIIVISNGTLVEQGSHEQLMFLKGNYYNLVASQESTTTLNDKELSLSLSQEFVKEINEHFKKTETLQKVC